MTDTDQYTWDSEKHSLYAVFACYRETPVGMCTYCYAPEELRVLNNTAPEALDTRCAQTLVMEVADHFYSPDVYRRFLPRILAALAPPELLEGLYPGHLFETLAFHEFAFWPNREQEPVIRFLTRLTPIMMNRRASDGTEWERGLERLRTEPLALGQ